MSEAMLWLREVESRVTIALARLLTIFHLIFDKLPALNYIIRSAVIAELWMSGCVE